MVSQWPWFVGTILYFYENMSYMWNRKSTFLVLADVLIQSVGMLGNRSLSWKYISSLALLSSSLLAQISCDLIENLSLYRQERLKARLHPPETPILSQKRITHMSADLTDPLKTILASVGLKTDLVGTQISSQIVLLWKAMILGLSPKAGTQNPQTKARLGLAEGPRRSIKGLEGGMSLQSSVLNLTIEVTEGTDTGARKLLKEEARKALMVGGMNLQNTSLDMETELKVFPETRRGKRGVGMHLQGSLIMAVEMTRNMH